MKKQAIIIPSCVIILIVIGAFIYKGQNNPIVGKWASTTDAKNVWIFKSNHIAKSYYDGKLDRTYAYKVTRDPVQCGVDMSETLNEHPDEHILVLTNTKTNKQKCYDVYALNKNYLTIRPFGYYTILHFKKQK